MRTLYYRTPDAMEAMLKAMKQMGHTPTNVKGYDQLAGADCSLCDASAEAEVDGDPDGDYGDWEINAKGRAVQTRCTGEYATSAHEYMDAIGGVQSWHEAQRALDLKHGGEQSLKLGSNLYLRRIEKGGRDWFAVRLYKTDVVTYRPDGSVEVRTGGWYSKLTRQTITDFTGLHVWSDGPLYNLPGEDDPDPRWFIMRPGAPVDHGWADETHPHHYVRFDRPLRLFPAGGSRELQADPTYPHYTLKRGSRRKRSRTATGKRGYGWSQPRAS